ncbi:isoprenylcysteine carboxylmethyltransferase family protein [Novosphingobium sp. FSY-8]|uniref:Isoprenylcysteine carboxylmethyltransferase family protein n=1 Tax=Novosphingobium ovatum TaxID=1908523 RepID=A0ABW9XEV6_9SPHN|nr:isoprenylcysteine carboxylmethyltransferase family protein [Novosphingobium ovatum]NBC37083.1 isoprenylcysteine carboxylmethyltransferase family protein [Novosphingobium ovatum]
MSITQTPPAQTRADDGWLDRAFARVAPRTLDRIEQGLILTLWVGLAWRAISSYLTDHNPLVLLLPVGELTVLIFVMIRRSTQNISLALGDWLLAITATAAPLLIEPAHGHVWPDALAWLIPAFTVMWVVGNLFQIWAKFSLRRSFGIAPANRGIKVDGPYRWVRHPMYAGYLWVHVAVLVMNPLLINVVIYGIGWWAQILRLKAEEKLLSQDPAYREFCNKVRYRLVPGLF